MNDLLRCTKCYTVFKSGEAVDTCPNCGNRLFPLFEETPLEERQHRAISLGDAFDKMFVRLFIGALIWIGLGALTLLSAIPYGGGNRLITGAFQVATLLILILAIEPFADVQFRRKEDDNIN